MPAPELRLEDSARFHAGGRQTVVAEGRSFESRDTLRWIAFDSLWWFRQNVVYELSRKYETQYQNLDLSGQYLRSRLAGREMALGLEWTPWLNLMQRANATGWFQGVVDLGPVWRAEPAGIPVLLRGGFSARGWNDQVPESVFDTPYDGFRASPGFYGGMSAGRGNRVVPQLPLYLSASAFGRYIEDAGFATAIGGALYTGGIPSGDSLFVYVADSLSDGRESYLSETSGGRTAAISTPWRIRNVLRVSAGLKGAVRLHVVPAVVYTYQNSALEYPEDPPGHLGDQRMSLHRVGLIAVTDTLLFFRYRGGLTLDFTGSDAAERANSYLVGDSAVRVPQASDDYDGGASTMEHVVAVPFRYGGRLEYRYFISRHSTTYRNEAVPAIPENFDDHDRQRQEQDVQVVLLDGERWQAGMSGGFTKDVLNYVTPERSGRNRTDRQYSLSATAAYRRNERLLISESLRAEANSAEFEFPQVHQGPEETPKYSRRFVSVLSASLLLGEHWWVKGKWNQTYWDDGRWYAREYLEEQIALGTVERVDYYAVERKSTEYRVELQLGWTPRKNLLLETGAALQDIYQREFSGSRYEVRHYGNGYVLEPYLRADWLLRDRFRLHAYVKRYVDTFDEDLWSLYDNWDIRLYLGVDL